MAAGKTGVLAATSLLLLAQHVSEVRAGPRRGLFDGMRRQADGESGDELVVKVNQGTLRGSKDLSKNGKPFLSFLGVPYAKPPVGNLRFRAPLPGEPWTGVRDATKCGPMCPQSFGSKMIRSPSNNHGRYWLDYVVAQVLKPWRNQAVNTIINSLPTMMSARNEANGMDEDCLYLNVFTPTVSLPTSELLPVLFYIHGGAFMWGSSDTYIFGPEYLMDRGLVVVSINYRLGPLGFLFSNSSDAPGNAGLKDQLLALKWVRDNIRAFGGDPDRVTLYGESAGSAATHYHVLSPLSAGLFSGAILSSSTTLGAVYLPAFDSTEILRRLAVQFGAPTTQGPGPIVNKLRTVPATVLSLTYLEIATEQELRSIVPALPAMGVVETPGMGEPRLIEESPCDALVSGRFNKVPIMIGSNFQEGTLFFATNSEVDFPYIERDKTRLIPKVLYDRMDSATRVQMGQKIWDTYLKGQRANREASSAFTAMWGDPGIEASIHISAFWHSLHVPVYRYHFEVDAYNIFSQFVGVSSHIRGPGHADDLGYIFYPRLIGDNNYPNGTQWKIAMERMTTMMANFCYYRNPTPEATQLIPLVWPANRQGTNIYLEFGEQLTVKRNLWPERMDLWASLHASALGHPVFRVPKSSGQDAQ